MTDVSPYIELITSWHRGKPKFTATVAALVAPAVALTDFNNALTTAFDLDTAVGVQLDKLGEWIGRSRDVKAELGVVFFSWDTPGLGWQEGYWQGAFDPITGMVKLDDVTYRRVLYAKVASNNWDGTLDGLMSILTALFPPSTGSLPVVIDNLNMNIDVGLSGKIPTSLFISLMTGGYVPIKPAGVQVNFSVTTVDDTPLFGFGLDSDSVAGFGVGAWGRRLPILSTF